MQGISVGYRESVLAPLPWLGHFGRQVRKKTREQQWTISCIYRAAVKVSEKLVLKSNLIACRSNISGLHFLAVILYTAVCVSKQNLITFHLYEPW